MTRQYYSVGGEVLGESSGSSAMALYLTDALGSVTSTSANTASTSRYSPYGEKGTTPANSTLGWVSSRGYRPTSRSFSSHYVRARHYAAPLGSWTSVDPLWPGESAYGYVNRNPVRQVDPGGEQDLSSFLQQILCPNAPPGMPPCSSTRGGRCPNQTGNSGRGYIDFAKFVPRPGEKDPESRIDRCDPKKVNKAAIKKRLDYVSDMVQQLCDPTKASQDIPGSGPYIEWVETVPCLAWEYSGGRAVRGFISYNIDCLNLENNILNDLFKDDQGRLLKDRSGIGCVACCLLKHETVHGLDIILFWPFTRTYGAECRGWKAELECLQRIDRGEPC